MLSKPFVSKSTLFSIKMASSKNKKEPSLAKTSNCRNSCRYKSDLENNGQKQINLYTAISKL